MTPQERAEARARHERVLWGVGDHPVCSRCCQYGDDEYVAGAVPFPWPCDAIEALDALDAAEARLEEQRESDILAFQEQLDRARAAEADARALAQATKRLCLVTGHYEGYSGDCSIFRTKGERCDCAYGPARDAVGAALAAHEERTL